MADDFRRIVSLQTLGTGIPADHITVGVQLEDGVLLNTFDEQPETFFAFPERAVRVNTAGDVFKNHAQEIIGKRKGPHGINALPDNVVAIRNFAQVPRLPTVQRGKQLAGKRCVKQLRKVRQGFSKQIW